MSANPPKPPAYMSKKNAHEIAQYAAKIDSILTGDENIPGWVEHKLSQARQMIGDVKHYLQYEREMSEAAAVGASYYRRYRAARPADRNRYSFLP